MHKNPQTAVINVKIEASLKKEAMQLAEDLGLTLSGTIHAFIKNFVRVKGVTFSLNKEELTPYTVDLLKKSQRDVDEGYVSPTFSDAKDAVAWLNDPAKKYRNEN